MLRHSEQLQTHLKALFSARVFKNNTYKAAHITDPENQKFSQRKNNPHKHSVPLLLCAISRFSNLSEMLTTFNFILW